MNNKRTICTCGFTNRCDCLETENKQLRTRIAAIEALEQERDQHWETIIRARDELLEWRHNETYDDGTLSEAGVAYDSALDLLPDALGKSAPDHDAEPDKCWRCESQRLTELGDGQACMDCGALCDEMGAAEQPEEAEGVVLVYRNKKGVVFEAVEGSHEHERLESEEGWERIGKVRVEK